MAVTSAKGKAFNPFSLDAVNFLLSDVRCAVGPYLNVFLVTQQHWSQSEVGVVTTISGLLGLAVQTPIGAAIDETRAKRPLVVFGLCVMLFHLANAALLPLVGQKLAAAFPDEATAMMSACIVAAQAVMADRPPGWTHRRQLATHQDADRLAGEEWAAVGRAGGRGQRGLCSGRNGHQYEQCSDDGVTNRLHDGAS
jgi:hypothetical protein